MKKNILHTFLLGASALVLGGLTSCEDFLTIYPTGSITKEDYWNTSNDVNNVRAAAYNQMTKLIDKILIWGEFRSDNVTLNKMDQTQFLRLQEAVLQPDADMFDWAGLYKGINFCNEVIDNGQTMVDNGVDPSFQQGDWAPIKAEMTALRALYYFYLVRAFRDVPYVKHSVSTDAEARASRIAATPGYEILEDLIKDVEEVQSSAPKNYGNATDNKGRWTTYSMSALLADMYLWRAALIKGIDRKTDATGAPYPYNRTEKADITTCLNKCIENCDKVIEYQQEEYKKSLDRLNVPAEDPRRKLAFPLTQNDKDLTQDLAYAAVFGSKNGMESVFELQFDGVNVKNTALSVYLYGNHSNTFTAGVMVANQATFCSNLNSTFSEKGYGKLDFRYLSYLLWEKQGQATYPIIKNVAQSCHVDKSNDVTIGYASSPSFRSNNNQSANWPVYRLADILLIKSEAIARTLETGGTASKALGFHMVNAILRRNIPAADSINSSNTNLYVERLNPNLSNNLSWADQDARTWSELLNYTMNERQREFIGEGKRWFDIVRECEWRGATEDVLADWMSAANSVKNRCRSLWSLYNPICTSEMKVNGVGYGDGQGKLNQNPVWIKYMTE